jgi:hypothetical protein
VAAQLLDALLLLNDEDVAAAIHSELRKLAISHKGPRRNAGLYTEREVARTFVRVVKAGLLQSNRCVGASVSAAKGGRRSSFLRLRNDRPTYISITPAAVSGCAP